MIKTEVEKDEGCLTHRLFGRKPNQWQTAEVLLRRGSQYHGQQPGGVLLMNG